MDQRAAQAACKQRDKDVSVERGQSTGYHKVHKDRSYSFLDKRQAGFGFLKKIYLFLDVL